jgi:hypothetical protein
MLNVLYLKYLEAIHNRICSTCIYHNSITGKCTFRVSGQVCPIELFYPQIVDVIKSSKSKEMSNYISGLQAYICINCGHQLKNGNCVLRDLGECELDRYFPEIVEIVEEIESQEI